MSSGIRLLDGPLTGQWWTLATPDAYGEFKITVALKPPVSFELLPPGTPVLKPEPIPQRVAIYCRTDSESGEARFVEWEDERQRREFENPTPMQRALANASDADILKLMDDLADAERKKKGGGK